MKKVVMILTGILAIVFLTGMANALTIDSSYGYWTGADGGVNVNYLPGTPPNSTKILWGIGWNGQTIDNQPQSGLGFDGVGTTTFGIDTPFNLGTLTHFNNPILSGTEATAAYLTVDLDFSVPDLPPLSFDFTFSVDETPNIGGDVDDIITFPTSFASESFALNSERYTLKLLGFGENADSIISSFSSPEGGDNATSLWGIITQSPVPEPAAILLFGFGLLGVAGIGRKK